MLKQELEIHIERILDALENSSLTDFGYIRSNQFVCNIVEFHMYNNFEKNLIDSFFKNYCLNCSDSSLFLTKHFNHIDRETKRKMILDTYFEIDNVKTTNR